MLLYNKTLTDENLRFFGKERKLNIVQDLIKLSLKLLMDNIKKANDEEENYCFGYLPVIVLGIYKCQLRAFNAPSFAERINSAENLTTTTKDHLSVGIQLRIKDCGS